MRTGCLNGRRRVQGQGDRNRHRATVRAGDHMGRSMRELALAAAGLAVALLAAAPQSASGQQVTPPSILSRASPDAMKRCYATEHPEADLAFMVMLDEQGKPTGVEFGPGAEPWMKQVATCVVLNMRFAPGKIDGRPVVSQAETAVTASAHNLDCPGSKAQPAGDQDAAGRARRYRAGLLSRRPRGQRNSSSEDHRHGIGRPQEIRSSGLERRCRPGCRGTVHGSGLSVHSRHPGQRACRDERRLDSRGAPAEALEQCRTRLVGLTLSGPQACRPDKRHRHPNYRLASVAPMMTTAPAPRA